MKSSVVPALAVAPTPVVPALAVAPTPGNLIGSDSPGHICKQLRFNERPYLRRFIKPQYMR